MAGRSINSPNSRAYTSFTAISTGVEETAGLIWPVLTDTTVEPISPMPSSTGRTPLRMVLNLRRPNRQARGSAFDKLAVGDNRHAVDDDVLNADRRCGGVAIRRSIDDPRRVEDRDIGVGAHAQPPFVSHRGDARSGVAPASASSFESRPSTSANAPRGRSGRALSNRCRWCGDGPCRSPSSVARDHRQGLLIATVTISSVFV